MFFFLLNRKLSLIELIPQVVKLIEQFLSLGGQRSQFLLHFIIILQVSVAFDDSTYFIMLLFESISYHFSICYLLLLSLDLKDEISDLVILFLLKITILLQLYVDTPQPFPTDRLSCLHNFPRLSEISVCSRSSIFHSLPGAPHFI